MKLTEPQEHNIIPKDSWKKGREAWDSKEWKEKRDDYLKGKTCEWCGSDENLQVHHRKSTRQIERERAFKRSEIANQILRREIEKEQTIYGVCTLLQKTKRYGITCRNCGEYYVGQTNTRCPHCDTRNYGTRKGVSGFLTSSNTVVQSSTKIIVQYGPKKWMGQSALYFLNKDDYGAFIKQYKQEIDEELDRLYPKPDYLDFSPQNVMALCKNCHYASHKGLHLCPICKQKYVSNRYRVCYECNREMIAENRKMMEEIEEADEKMMEEIDEEFQKIGKETNDKQCLQSHSPYPKDIYGAI